MSVEIKSNNKLIAKNTILLYIRMVFMFAISLFTSRVVLQTLGIVDYGIYNVVGGVISMFSFLTAAMSSSTQRYITFYLGQGEQNLLQKVFSMAVIIHFLIAMLIFVLGETIGLWFVLNKLVIPAERMNAALWVYQLSIFTAMVNIVSVPYNADIIAHEKMSAFAYISILEVILKLIIVYLLCIIPYDKLKSYALLLFILSLSIRAIYGLYCRKHFIEAKFKFFRDKNLLKEMTSFAGWNLWGGLANIMSTQGVNMLLNMFFGPAVNAARGVAVQVQHSILQFSTNFQTALNPQITKSYAVGNFADMHTLIMRSSKFSFFLLFLICLPIELETFTILELWLDIVPKDADIFIKIILATTIIDAMANPIMIANAATGRVKVYQLIIGTILLFILPISYITLKLGCEPWAVFIVHLFVSFTCFIARLLLVRPLINLSLKEYFIKVIKPSFLVLVLSSSIPLIFKQFLEGGFTELLLITIVSVLWTLISIFAVGLTSNERIFILSKLKKIIKFTNK